MSTVHVVKLDPVSQWDQNILDLLWANELSPTGLDFVVHHNEYPAVDGIVLVIPGRYYCDDEFSHDFNVVNHKIAQYRWVLGIKTGDEEDSLDFRLIEHLNIRWWVQTPRIERDYDGARLFGVGFPPHFNDLDRNYRERDIDVYLAAQNTHPRRFEAFEMIQHLDVGHIVTHESPGFTQGLTPEQYTANMLRAKIAICPSGPVSPDTFRLYEALEAHCVPIADDVCANHSLQGYWHSVFPDAPFPILTDYKDLPLFVDDVMASWVYRSNRIAAWWMRQKREYVRWLHLDLEALGATLNVARDAITVVVPISPIPSHPAIDIIAETVESVRYWLPEAEIILSFDGVRPEQEHMREAYEEAIRLTLWKADREWGHVTPIVFDQHLHQSGMMQRMIDKVSTPLLMYVEHDCPLVTDWPIPWDRIKDLLLNWNADVVRLHHEALILPSHEHLMLERWREFRRTRQWSQRPHVARSDFYRHILQNCFTRDTKAFIEERMASVLQSNPRDMRVFIYAPENTDNVKRSYTLDGRAGESQFIESQVF